MKIIWILSTFFFGLQVQAFELVIVQTISDGGRSFVTRTGKKLGVYQGQKAVFSSEAVALGVEAVSVTGDYTVWAPLDPQARVPFSRNEIVEFNPSLESIYYQLRLQEKVSERIKAPIRNLILKGHYSLGVSESTSGVPDQDVLSQANHIDFMYQKELTKYFFGAVGMRYDQQISEGRTFNLNQNRYMATVDLSLHLPKFDQIPMHFYAGVGAAYGISSQEISGTTASGKSFILPNIRAGFEIPMGDSKYSVLIEGAFEAYTDKTQFDTFEQSTSGQTFKTGVGLKMELGKESTF